MLAYVGMWVQSLDQEDGEENDNPLHYSCQENPMYREAWQAAVHEVQRVRYNLTTENE